MMNYINMVNYNSQLENFFFFALGDIWEALTMITNLCDSHRLSSDVITEKVSEKNYIEGFISANRHKEINSDGRHHNLNTSIFTWKVVVFRAGFSVFHKRQKCVPK